jgi:hypothetical protein
MMLATISGMDLLLIALVATVWIVWAGSVALSKDYPARFALCATPVAAWSAILLLAYLFARLLLAGSWAILAFLAVVAVLALVVVSAGVTYRSRTVAARRAFEARVAAGQATHPRVDVLLVPHWSRSHTEQALPADGGDVVE